MAVKVVKTKGDQIVKEFEFTDQAEAISFMYENNGIVKPWGYRYMMANDFETKKGRANASK